MEDLFPGIAAFAKQNDISVRDMSEASCLEDLFVIPVSENASLQLEEMSDRTQNYTLLDTIDQRVFCWGNSVYKASQTL